MHGLLIEHLIPIVVAYIVLGVGISITMTVIFYDDPWYASPAAILGFMFFWPLVGVVLILMGAAYWIMLAARAIKGIKDE